MSTPPPRASGPVLLALLCLASACTESATDPDTGNEVTGVTVSLELNPVPLPSTVQASVAVTPAGAPQGVTWSSSDPEVATVDGSGLVTTRLRGTTTITATSTANPDVSGSVVLNTECPEPRRVAANISGDATWENWVPDPVCFDYVVETSLHTSSGTLVIEPGTRVGFEENVGLRVVSSAGMIAAGTEAEPIVLTGTSGQRGFWKGVSLESASFSEYVVTHTTIEYTGGASISQREDASLMISNGVTVRLENNTLRNAEGYGLFLGAGADVVGEGNNVLTANSLGAAYVAASEAEHLKPGADLLLGNDVDVVVVAPNRLDDEHVWPRATYRVLRTGPEQLRIFGLLRLTAGTEVRLVGDQAVMVLATGGLNAVGTATDPILITGDEAVPGHWRGLAFVGSDHPDNALEHVTIEYGGRAAIGAGVSDRANLSLVGAGFGTTSRVRIQNSSFRQSAEFGVFVSSSAEFAAFSGNVLTQNPKGPASMHPAVVGDIQPGNDFTGNGVDEITVNLGVSMRFDGPTTWIDPGVPYFMRWDTAPYSTVEGQAFTLEPGVELLFGPDVGLVLGTGSTFTAEGTPNNPISLRGRSGAWRGLQFRGATGSLAHIDIADGGSHAWGSELEPGQISLRIGAMSEPARVSLGENVSFSGGGFNLAFGYGETTVTGCVLPVFIPFGDVFADHCG